jgi:pimeloyl-ACP methyl ester carboxylesterase
MQFKKEGKFSYYEKGEGKPIILLHGLFGALSNFTGVIDEFAPKYRMIMPMLPIYELPLLKTNVKNLTKYLEKFIAHMNFDKVTLLGNSLGGHVGLVYTDMYPEKVERLVLTGSSGLYENAFGGGFPRREDKSFLRERIAHTFYDQEHVTDELVDQCHEAVNNKEKVIRIISIAKSAIRHNMKDPIEKFNMPTCLIWGKQDSITPPATAEEFHSGIKTSELFWIDKCGHAAMMERPEEFNKILGDWLAKHP